MKLQQVIQYIRLKTGTDEYTLPNSDILLFLNGIIDDFALLGTMPDI